MGEEISVKIGCRFVQAWFTMMNDKNRFWLDRSVLVTGSTGLVGSWVVKTLLARGSNIVTLVRDWVPTCELVRSGVLEKISIVRGDVCNLDLLERTVAEYEVTTVIHLAAQTIVGIANRSPLSTFETNITGTWNILEASRRVGGVEQIVVASSDKAYGKHKDLPYDENNPLQGEHPYDVSKSCADLIAHTYHVTYGLPIIITRCGNFYGGGDLNWNRIVPGTIRSVLRDKRPIIRSDGTFVRDYFYVEDGANAYLLLAKELAHNPKLSGEAFNFSNESPVTVLELVDTILELMDARHLPPIIENNVKNEIPEQYLSAKKARELLGWSPQFDMKIGLEHTIEWYKHYFSDHEEELHD